MPLKLPKKLLRFAVVGGGVTLLHILVAVFLIKIMGASPAIANGVAFGTATLVSYAANTLWSFSAQMKKANLVRFLTVSAVGLVLATVSSGFIDSLGLHYGLGIALVVIVVPGVTFSLHNFWTYADVE